LHSQKTYFFIKHDFGSNFLTKIAGGEPAGARNDDPIGDGGPDEVTAFKTSATSLTQAAAAVLRRGLASAPYRHREAAFRRWRAVRVFEPAEKSHRSCADRFRRPAALFGKLV
jgi:hypothetical protein